VILCAACAQIEPPSGGPEDREAPRVVGTFPDSGAVRVTNADSLVLQFSEPMNRRTVEESFFLSPPVEYRERSWEKQTWILRLSQPLESGRTYVGLLGLGAKDRHGNGPKIPWSFAFSTGDSLDTGRVSGKVIGQRYSPHGAFVYVWNWESAPPDSTKEGYPADPLRLGQADAQGTYELTYLPRDRELRVCALYNQSGDQKFNPNTDHWGCLEDPLVIADTARVVSNVDLYLTYPDEPGTVAGTAADSACIRSKAKAVLARVRAQKDSLRHWLDEGVPDTTGGSEGATVPRPITPADSLRIGHELLSLDSLRTGAEAESAFCARPIFVQLLSDTTVTRESRSGASFKWSDVPPGIYHLFAFRDLNANGRADPEEPQVRYPQAIEVRPLLVLDHLDLVLPPRGSAP
jgi:hypothetical protein